MAVRHPLFLTAGLISHVRELMDKVSAQIQAENEGVRLDGVSAGATLKATCPFPHSDPELKNLVPIHLFDVVVLLIELGDIELIVFACTVSLLMRIGSLVRGEPLPSPRVGLYLSRARP